MLACVGKRCEGFLPKLQLVQRTLKPRVHCDAG
jgi:hypothetical protein